MARQWQIILGCGLLVLAAWLALRGAAPVGAATLAGAAASASGPALLLVVLGGAVLTAALAAFYRARLSR